MSYSLYSFLKENPRLNGPKVNYNWADILTNNEVPQSVKTELNELINAQFITLSDAVLFWSHHVQMLRMLDPGEYKSAKRGPVFCVHQYPIYPEFASQFSLTVYSLTQLEPDRAQEYANKTYRDIFEHEARRELYNRLTNWTIDKLKRLFDNTSSSNILGRIYYGNHALGDNECYDFFAYLDESFMQVVRGNQIYEIKQLLKDCDVPAEDQKFKSMNDIERAHDARTERETKKMEARDLVKYTYHMDLVNIATKYGFTLPASNTVMIRRGRQHNNCVATYASKHASSIHVDALNEAQTHEVSRLFFTETATLELSIEYCAYGIVSTKVVQYKGRFNKDATRDKALLALRIALVGLPAEVLVVRQGNYKLVEQE
jgi:hypothetical protein